MSIAADRPLAVARQPAPRAVRVLMAGPRPPAIGGMVSVMQDLCGSSLADEFGMQPFDTGKATAADRSLAAAVQARLRLWARWWQALRPAPVVAHVHTCSGLSFFLDGGLVALAWLRRVPVVLHVHGGGFESFLARLSLAPRALARWIARRASRVVVLSESWKQRLAPLLPGAQLQVVENGVPLPAPRAAARAAEPAPLLLFVGAVCAAKGLDELVQAFAALDAAARLAIVGPETEPGFAHVLRARAEALGVADRVELAGAADAAARSDWLARADVFVLPSHLEALPVALLEAMAAGLPAVATRVGAIPDVIADGSDGLLVAPRDVQALAAALRRLVGDAELRDRIGRQARLTCEQRFGVERAADALRALYRELAPVVPADRSA